MIILPSPDERREATRRLTELSSQTIALCLQCGKCTAGCPFASDMDKVPHQIVHMAQLGLISELTHCDAIWYCATCFTCVSRCPVAIDIAAVAEAVRLLANLEEDTVKFGPDQISSEVASNAPQQALVSLYRKFGS
jgi:heterodisulfide reductase subunit C2